MKLWLTAALALTLMAMPRAAMAQPTVTVTVPAGVTFSVRNVSVATAGSPATTQLTYLNPNTFPKNNHLQVSVIASAANFSGPDTAIPAAKVSWTATATNGSAFNGTLSSAAYTAVYSSPTGLKAGNTGTITLSWQLAAIAAAGLRSGTHTLVIRWKFESLL